MQTINATTRHAQVRSQQRAIAPMVIDLLLLFGKTERAGDGTNKYYFDKGSRRRVRAYAGPLAAVLDQHLDVYAIVSSDSTVITVAHRTERIKRN